MAMVTEDMAMASTENTESTALIRRKTESAVKQVQIMNENNEKNSNDEYIRRERSFGSYCRSFDISGIDESAIDAAYTNGILTLTLPKKEKQQPESKRIEIQ